jgi:lipoate-protein ligase A
MAIDEAIFRLYDEIQLNTIRFYAWKPSAVSIGKHQRILDEVDLDTLQELDFDCIRRISGGGTVFHDALGELTYSIVTDTRNLQENTIEGNYYELSKLIFNPLEKIGLVLDYGKIHCPSVFVKGKKISGNAQARNGHTILQHGTILVKFRPEIMYSVLKARPGRTRESMVESVYQHITTLEEMLNKDVSPQGVAEYIIRFLTETKLSQFTFGELTSEEKLVTLKLASDKYESEEWLYSK